MLYTSYMTMRNLLVAVLAVIVVSVTGATAYIAGWYSSLRSDRPAEILEAISIDIRPQALDADQIVALVNNERIKASLAPLNQSVTLSQSACAKLEHMVNGNYWAHIAPDGTEPWRFIGDAGYSYVNAGENLAYGQISEEATIDGWMNSQSHKDNVLGGFIDIGTCTRSVKFQGGYFNLTVQHYATPR